jgi:hypothetical protein
MMTRREMLACTLATALPLQAADRRYYAGIQITPQSFRGFCRPPPFRGRDGGPLPAGGGDGSGFALAVALRRPCRLAPIFHKEPCPWPRNCF